MSEGACYSPSLKALGRGLLVRVLRNELVAVDVLVEPRAQLAVRVEAHGCCYVVVWCRVAGGLVSCWMLGCRVARGVLGRKKREEEKKFFRRAKVFFCPDLRLPITSRES